MAILVVGSVVLDSIKTPHGAVEDVLGGSASFFATAAAPFSEVRLVGVVGGDFPRGYHDFLRGKKIDLRGLDVVPGGKTFRWKGEYSADMNQRTSLCTELNVFADFSPKLPEPYRATPIAFLGNIDPVLQSRVLDQTQSPWIKACDTMNFWISGRRDELRDVLKRVDIFFINDSEAEELVGIGNVFSAGRKLLEWGPSTVVIKRGEHGSLVLRKDMLFLLPAFPLLDVVDPTGAGDTFAGGFLGYLDRVATVDNINLRWAAVYGTVVASFTCQGFGLDGIGRVSFADIQARAAEFLRCVEIDGDMGRTLPI